LLLHHKKYHGPIQGKGIGPYILAHLLPKTTLIGPNKSPQNVVFRLGYIKNDASVQPEPRIGNTLMKELKSTERVNARLRIPGSKSISHRVAIAAALGEGESHIRDFLRCDDTLYTTEALARLGVDISFGEGRLQVTGSAGDLFVPPAKEEIYLGNSGTSLRLLLSVAALARGNVILTGSPRLNERPISDLIKALAQLGVNTQSLGKPGFPPVLVRGEGISGGGATVDATQSSQFVSSILLCAPYAQRDVEIQVTGDRVSLPYIDLTLDVMERFGVSVEREGYKYFRVRAGQRYAGQDLTIEGDVSSASYFWAAAAVTGGQVITENIYPYSTKQGDIGFLHLLEEMGCQVKREKDQVTVRGAHLRAIEADLSQMPDMVPTLAAVSLFAQGSTFIRNVAHLRHKESDRLHTIATQWKLLGARVDELEDGLVIYGEYPLKPAPTDPHDDHRLAMSLAVIGLKLPGMVIKNQSCVNKSYPEFWSAWDKLCPQLSHQQATGR